MGRFRGRGQNIQFVQYKNPFVYGKYPQNIKTLCVCVCVCVRVCVFVCVRYTK